MPSHSSAAKWKKQYTSSALYLDNALLWCLSPRLMNSFSRTAVWEKYVTGKREWEREREKRTNAAMKWKWAGRRRDGETAQGNNSANGVTVWIFSRSRNGDYDLAISVTRFYWLAAVAVASWLPRRCMWFLPVHDACVEPSQSHRCYVGCSRLSVTGVPWPFSSASKLKYYGLPSWKGSVAVPDGKSRLLLHF